MRIVKYCILIILCSCKTEISGAQDTLHFKINWQAPIPSWFPADSAGNKLLFNFEDGKYNQGIPVFVQNYPAPPINGVKIKILSVLFDTISDLVKYSHVDDIPDSIAASVNFFKSEKKNIIQLSFIPIVKQGNIALRIKEISFLMIKGAIQVMSQNKALHRWKSSSVFKDGVWKKITVSETGIYKITYSQIKSLGFSNPSEIKVYGNGGKMLPERYAGTEADDPEEIPVYMYKGSDNVFNEGDYILFYGTGPVSWTYDSSGKKFVHTKHGYTNKSVYFLTTGTGGKKIEDALLVTDAENVSVSSFVDYAYHEQNLNNLIQSGRMWVGEAFALQTSQTFSFSFPNAVENSPFLLEGDVEARSYLSTSFTIKAGSVVLKSQAMSNVIIGDESSNYADSRSFILKGTVNDNSINLGVSFNKNGDNGAEGWLNYLRLNVKRKLIYNNAPLLFRDTTLLGQNQTINYQITGQGSGLLLWDVSNQNMVKNVAYSYSTGIFSFKSKTDTLHEFALFDPSQTLLVPDFLSEPERTLPNQDLHALSGIDMVILSHTDFLEPAEVLAQLHRDNDNLRVQIVTPEQVYNEFSSGNPDPAAIRNFMKMLYDKAVQPSDMPKYLLLLGDGSYENFSDNISTQPNTNYILTYQSVNSLRPVSSYVSDDYYGILDDNEGIENGFLDVGVGRFPVTTKEQVYSIINKIKSYISASAFGDWRNNICFLADDEDNNIHMSQADQLTSYLQNNYPDYNFVKIFSDAYPQVTTSSGTRYPEVTKAIENALNKGVLIVNYTGHGGPRGLGHERFISDEDIQNWGNRIYPLFVTATCEFSRFDDKEDVTAGEKVLLNPHGGSIGLLTTTRLVYSGPNFVLNQQFYKNFNLKDSNGDYLRLGDILKNAKNASGTDVNKLNFTLLGDPALRLAYPRYAVKTTEINALDVNVGTDTLKAYKEVTVKGIVNDENGNLAQNFNGTIKPSLFDKSQVVKTLSNDGGEPFSFNQQESILFKGKASVRNGLFEFSFIVPREIAYNFGKGRFSYYAFDDQMDASGYFDNFVLGGISSESNVDNTGPDIQLYLNDTTFRNGGVANQYPRLMATLKDNSGINIAGTGIGHDITATLDNNTSASFILNNYYEAAIDDYTLGNINYQLPRLDPGIHSLKLKAWDIFNNSSETEIKFEVIDSSSLIVKNVRNYPNPVLDYTYFVFEHNQPGKKLNAELQIFGISGNMVMKQKMQIMTDGFSSGPIFWDRAGNNFQKLEKGVYIYRFIVRYNKAEFVSESKKMVVLE